MDQKTVRELFEYRDGVLYWRKKPSNNVDITKPTGTLGKRGYFVTGFKRKLYYNHRLTFLLFHGYLPKEIDHIDNNRLNNKIENLRFVSRKRNNQNSKIRSNNTSGYKGVSFYKNKWTSYITVDRNRIHLGCFDTPEEAHRAYCKAADKHFGEFANYGY